MEDTVMTIPEVARYLKLSKSKGSSLNLVLCFSQDADTEQVQVGPSIHLPLD
jgi:hypothetical protein